MENYKHYLGLWDYSLRKNKVIMFKKPNSTLTFICSIMSFIYALEYLTWPKVENPSAIVERGIIIKIIAGIIFLILSFYFSKRAKNLESPTKWIKWSSVLNMICVTLYICMVLFYIYSNFIK